MDSKWETIKLRKITSIHKDSRANQGVIGNNKIIFIGFLTYSKKNPTPTWAIFATLNAAEFANEILQFLIEIRILVPHKVYVYTQIQPSD